MNEIDQISDLMEFIFSLEEMSYVKKVNKKTKR